MKNSIATLCLVASFVYLSGCNPRDEVETAADAGPSRAISIDRVTAGAPIRKTLKLFTEQPGRVVPFEEAPIHSKLSGYIESVHYDLGDKVAKGQVLVRIHAPEYQDELEQKRGLLGQAQAQVKQAEASLVAAQAALHSTKAMVDQTRAGVGRTDAEYARWESELKRIEQLVSKGAVTPKLADETSSQFQSAEAARKEVLAQIEFAKAQEQEAEANVLTAMADIDAAKAKLNVAESDVAHAQTILKYTELASPFDGFITSRNVDAGHYVQPAGSTSARPLMTVANIARVRVFVNIPESQAAWVDAGFGKPDAGDLVTILSPSLAGGKIDARVTRTSLQLDPQSRSLSVEIDLDNHEFKLLPGAFVTAKVLLEQRDDAMTLPIGAIIKDADGSKCCVVIDGKIEHRRIELGLRVGDDVEIKSGLEGHESVVLVRASSMEVGQAVEIM